MLQISTQIIKSVQDGVAIDLSPRMSGTTIGLSVSHRSECICGNTATGLRAHMDGATIDLRAFMRNIAIGYTYMGSTAIGLSAHMHNTAKGLDAHRREKTN